MGPQVLSHAMSAPGMEERLGEQLLRNLVWVVRAMVQQQDAAACLVLSRIARAGRLHFGPVVSALAFYLRSTPPDTASAQLF
jgi:hypothetical protein